MVKGQMEGAGKSSEESARRFADEMVEQLNGSLRDSFSSMGEHVHQLTSGVQGASSTLHEVISKMQTAAEQQQQHFQQSSEAMRLARAADVENTKSLSDSKDLATKLSALMDGLAERQSTSLALHDQQARLQQQGEEASISVSDRLREATAAYGETAANLSQLLPRLEASVEAIVGSTRGLADSATRAAETTAVSVDSFQQRAHFEASLVEQFKSVTSDFTAAMGKSRPLLESMSDSADAIYNTQREARQLVELLAGVTEKLGGLTERVSTDLNGVVQSMAGVSSGLRESLSATETWTDQTNQAIERFGTGVSAVVESSLSEYDTSLTNAVSSLRSVMGGLADELATTIESLESLRPAAGPRGQ